MTAPSYTQSHQAPEVTLEYIGPDEAKRYLAMIQKNRKIKMYHVSALSEQMTSGLWNVTGETIKVDSNGHVIDGQHRLLAVVKSGVTIQALVARGLSPDAQLYVDTTTARRSAGDVFQFANVPNATNTAAVMRWIVAYEHREWGRFSFQKRGPVILLNRYNADPMRIQDCVRMTSHQRLASNGMLGAVCYVLMNIDADRAHAFMQLLLKGANLDADHPVYVLRERLIRNAAAGAPSAGRRKVRKAPAMEQCAWIVRAWNSVLQGQPIKILKWTIGIDRFPEILGGQNGD